MSSQPSVLGDFVWAQGPGTAEWLAGLDGFTVTDGVAARGKVQRGEGWVALADLIEGDLAAGTRALDGDPPQRDWRGRFAQVVWKGDRVAALTDHFSTLSLYTLQARDVLVIGTDLRILARSPFSARTLDLEAIYHYFNFAHTPAPRTIFREIRRLEPATRFSRSGETRYHVHEYPDDLPGSDAQLADELRDRMVQTVSDYRPPAEAWGCFLSGGTDSSSIVSILSRKGRVKSFSIGFAEAGFDELDFARLAAQSCGAEPTFHSVSRAEAQSLLERVIRDYDQPFGGASAVPTIACADLAHHQNVELLVAGDGGDEIFGGNQRYAKDQVMEAWYGLPAPLKRLGNLVGGALGGSNLHFFNRVENFFNRASLPNPDRFYTDDSFASDHYEELLRPEFRRAVARDASLEFMRGVYRLGKSGGAVHRVMRLDLMMAVAQHDLRKVHFAAKSASVSVRFPYLDTKLVAWVNRLSERQKVRGLQKRYLFKRAMRDILPQAILRKKKQGFGLPIEVWLRSDKAFQSMVRDVLFSDRARGRGWWEPAFVEKLIAEHEKGAWDHADYIWRLLVLELWLRKWVDAA